MYIQRGLQTIENEQKKTATTGSYMRADEKGMWNCLASFSADGKINAHYTMYLGYFVRFPVKGLETKINHATTS